MPVNCAVNWCQSMGHRDKENKGILLNHKKNYTNMESINILHLTRLLNIYSYCHKTGQNSAVK